MYTIKAERIFLEDIILLNGIVTVDNGYITNICENSGTADISCHTLMPGFIDIHVHGGNGYDTMDATYEALKEISKYKVKEGVTSFCPATVTTSLEKTSAAIKNVDTAIKKGIEGAEILGVFLEGPYISKDYNGAHPTEYIREIDINELETLIAEGEHIISAAVAPEKQNAEAAIQLLKNKGIGTRIGHSAADAETVEKAVRYGADIAIHTFNAMSPFTHRQPGMAGCVMYNNNIYAELICDFVHVHPRAVEVLYKMKGADKLILITDCMRAGGLPDGNYYLGELPVIVKNKTARTENGALAGSTLTMIDAVKNLHSLGVSLFDAVKTASFTPAKALRINNVRGSIAVGKKADFAAADLNMNISFVTVNGRLIYSGA